MRKKMAVHHLARIETILAAFFLFLAVVTAQDQVDVFPRSPIVATANQNVSMVCKVAYPITSCRVTIQGRTHFLQENKPYSGDNIAYFGTGFQNGECGVQIRRVEESMNGEIKCSLPPRDGTIEPEGIAKLIIAKAPEQTVLQVNQGTQGPNTFRVGDELRATCVVRHGRPAAQLRWFLEGPSNRIPLLEGLHQPVFYEEPGTDLVTTAQNLTRKLRADDNGQQLVCQAEHVALPQPSRSARQLEVHYEPQPREDPIYIFGIHLGSMGLLNVTIRANPRPTLEWNIGGDTVNEGTVDRSERIEALTAIPLGNGFYNATLRISNIIKEDTEVQYELRVRNSVDLQVYRVRISTLEEPMSLSLDAGSIVGIVIAVLILLLIIIIIVFAKATNRWCFGARPSSDEEKETRPKNSGESSDTESAVGGAKQQGASEKRRRIELPEFARSLPAQLRAVLPGRNKDRVAQADVEIETKTTTEDDKTDGGDKKSIVYAELALSHTDEPQAKPHPESTEYAEIQYADKKVTPKKEESK